MASGFAGNSTWCLTIFKLFWTVELYPCRTEVCGTLAWHNFSVHGTASLKMLFITHLYYWSVYNHVQAQWMSLIFVYVIWTGVAAGSGCVSMLRALISDTANCWLHLCHHRQKLSYMYIFVFPCVLNFALCVLSSKRQAVTCYVVCFSLLQHCEPAVWVDGPVQCMSHPCVRYQAVVAHCVIAIVLHKSPELVKKHFVLASTTHSYI